MKCSYILRFFFYSCLIIVLILSVIPQNEVVLTTGWDKTNHVLAFFVLLFLYDIAYPAVSLYKIKCSLLMCYGFIIEFIQFFTPDRFISLGDILADGLGLLLYVFIRPVVMSGFPFMNQNDRAEKD